MSTTKKITKVVYSMVLPHNGLQSKKRAWIETISEDFPTKWLNILYDAERK